MPCLFAILAVSFPRVGLLCLWLFTPLVNAAFNNNWLWPLLGLVFLPFTTLMFALVVGPLGPTNFWGWLMVISGGHDRRPRLLRRLRESEPPAHPDAGDHQAGSERLTLMVVDARPSSAR